MTGVLAVIEMLGNTIQELQAENGELRRRLADAERELSRPQPTPDGASS